MAQPQNATSDLDKTKEELIAELEILRARRPSPERGPYDDSVSAELIYAGLDATPALIAYVDNTMRYRYVNRAYSSWFGVPSSEIVGKPVEEFLGAGGYAAVKKAMKQVLNGEVVTHRNALEVAGGALKHVEARLVPQIDGDGRVAGYFSMVFDITDRVEAEDELRQSEERYRGLVEISPDAVYVHRDFELLFMNPAGAKMFALNDADDPIGESLFRFIDPSDHEVAKSRYEGLLRGVPQPPREFLMRRADGTPVYARTVMVPITWKGQTAVMIVCHNITEQREIEAALDTKSAAAEIANARFLEAVENIPEAFAIFDSQERLEFFNSNYVDVVWRHIRDAVIPGASLAELVREQASRELELPPDHPDVEDVVVKAMHRHRTLPSATEMLRPDGRWIKQSKRRTPDGRVVAIYADISDAKRREAEIAESEERYRRVVEGSPDAIKVSSNDRIVYVNEAAVRLFGAKSANELIGRERREFRIPGEENLPEMLTSALGTAGRAARIENQKRIRVDGTVVDVDVSSVRILWYGADALMLMLL